MIVLYALLIFFLVFISSQEQYNNGSGGGKDGTKANFNFNYGGRTKTSFNFSYGGVPSLASFPGFGSFSMQFNFENSAPQLPQRNSVILRDEVYSTCKNGSFVSYPDDCTMYLWCMCGKCETYKCISGYHWNANKKICDSPDKAKCTFIKSEKIQPPLSPPVTTPSTTTIVTPATTTVASINKCIAPKMTEKPVYDGTGYKVICYFTNWAVHRHGDGKYIPNDIDETLCTHINYAYAVLNDSTLTIKSDDAKSDIEIELYKKVTALYAKGIKVLIAIGGWKDSFGDKYSRLVNNPSARKKFITNVIQFIAKYNFDGLNLEWRQPKCWQNDCNKGPNSDKQAFTALVRELSVAFKPKCLLLSATVSPNQNIIDESYEVVQLSKYLDWITVMTYDYFGHWCKQTGHIAPLYPAPGDTEINYNTNFSLNYWIDQGANPQKIIMGIPLYGQSFSLIDASNNELNSTSKGPGEPGEFTQRRGNLAYYEICDRVKNRGWTTVQDNTGHVGPYAYSKNQWVSYDDVRQIIHKSKFIKKMNLGGGMIWALDYDDFKNRCGCGKYPLLKALNHKLRGIKIDTKITDCT